VNLTASSASAARARSGPRSKVWGSAGSKGCKNCTPRAQRPRKTARRRTEGRGETTESNARQSRECLRARDRAAQSGQGLFSSPSLHSLNYWLLSAVLIFRCILTPVVIRPIPTNPSVAGSSTRVLGDVLFSFPALCFDSGSSLVTLCPGTEGSVLQKRQQSLPLHPGRRRHGSRRRVRAQDDLRSVLLLLLLA
jgi:hypothetical protein